MKLIWLGETRADIQRLYDYLVARSPAAATKAIQAIRDGAGQLRTMPELGRLMEGDPHRRELFIWFGGGAYVLRYRLDRGAVVILRVWHSREAR